MLVESNSCYRITRRLSVTTESDLFSRRKGHEKDIQEVRSDIGSCPSVEGRRHPSRDSPQRTSDNSTFDSS